MGKGRRGRGAVAACVAVLLALAGCRTDAPAVAPEDPPDTPAEPAPDAGVTDAPCPHPVNSGNGCIFLGTISDLSAGPFSELAADLTQAQEAFWARVNAAGGVGGYDIDVTTHVVDGGYDPSVHSEAYESIAGQVLALAQTLGTGTTAAIRDRMAEDGLLGVPAAWHSHHAWDAMLLPSGASYCVQAMNAVDVAVEEFGAPSVMAVHYPGDFGEDAAAGARLAAEAHGIPYEDAVLTADEEAVDRVAAAVVEAAPGAVVVATGPLEAAALVARAAASGFTGAFVGAAPTFHPELLETPAADPLVALFLLVLPWAPWDADTEGHVAMREWIGGLYSDVTPTDAHTAGWVLQYPLLAVLERAADAGRLTRPGLREAARTLGEVDYEGMLPTGSGAAPGVVGRPAAREVVLAQPDPEATTGLRVVRDAFAGPVAETHAFDEPCT